MFCNCFWELKGVKFLIILNQQKYSPWRTKIAKNSTWTRYKHIVPLTEMLTMGIQSIMVFGLNRFSVNSSLVVLSILLDWWEVQCVL